MSKTVRILHLEDSTNDADLVRMRLARSDLSHDLRVAATRDEYLTALCSGEVDLILADGSIPGFGGRSALQAAREQCPGVPLIFVCGHPNVGTDPDNSKFAGSAGYVSKTDLEGLVPAIKRAIENNETSTRKNKLDTHENPTEQLIHIVQQLSLARDLPSVMAIVRSAARELTGADGATFVLRERDLCYYAEEDAIGPLWKGKRFPMTACISGWVMLNKQPAVIEDIFSDSRIPVDVYRPTFVKSLAMVPIRTTSPVGAIGNYWATRHKVRPEELRLLQALANSTSIAMENVQLYGELEQQVRERTAQLEAANEELEAFTYSVSHDLRAPLRHIDAFSNLLLENSGNQLDDASNDYVRRIHRAISRMGQLIDDLLKLSHIARAEISKETVDLTQMAEEIVSELQAATPNRWIEFTIGKNISANGDSRLLRVALENLFSNAWKYTSKKPQACIDFSCKQRPTGQMIYTVQDNGAGFDMTYIEKLFGPFQRLHSDSEFPGTGVGLATVQRIIHKHGGKIWAKAVEGEGATFSFTLGFDEKLTHTI